MISQLSSPIYDIALIKMNINMNMNDTLPETLDEVLTAYGYGLTKSEGSILDIFIKDPSEQLQMRFVKIFFYDSILPMIPCTSMMTYCVSYPLMMIPFVKAILVVPWSMKMTSSWVSHPLLLDVLPTLSLVDLPM